MKKKKTAEVECVASNDVLCVMTNAELQTAIDSLLNHAGKQKRSWYGSLCNNNADGALSDCLAKLLYIQAKRAGPAVWD